MKRDLNRRADQMREITIDFERALNGEGSAFLRMGRTEVLAVATVESKVPPFLRGATPERGWVTAEYSMLPRSTSTRMKRERRGARSRTMEIERLIGRSLRAGVDLEKLGARAIIVDCDILSADGGTRCASITAGYLAMARAIKSLLDSGELAEDPIESLIAAVSIGLVDGQTMVDLDYAEDSRATVDMNLAMTDSGGIVEIQASAEGAPYSRDTLDRFLHSAAAAIGELHERQRAALAQR